MQGIRVLAVTAALIALPALAVAEPTALETTQKEARDLHEYAHTDLGRTFLEAAAALPPMTDERIIFYRRHPRSALTRAQYDKLPEAEREQYEETRIGESHYYRLYSTPVAYLRAMDIVAQAGLKSVDGKRVADFGFGNMGQLRMLAGLGAHVVGIEIDGYHDAFLGKEDEGKYPRAPIAGDGKPGSVTLAFGQFPVTKQMTKKVGKKLSLFMSKNTLKLGYIHPEREADPSRLIHLGVDDQTYLEHVYDALEPGGYFLVYNIYGNQNPPDQPYKPWATGEFPFDRELTEKTGFEVIHWNLDDSEEVREIGMVLGWNGERSREEFADSFHAMVTLLRRPVKK